MKCQPYDLRVQRDKRISRGVSLRLTPCQLSCHEFVAPFSAEKTRIEIPFRGELISLVTKFLFKEFDVTTTTLRFQTFVQAFEPGEITNIVPKSIVFYWLLLDFQILIISHPILKCFPSLHLKSRCVSENRGS